MSKGRKPLPTALKKLRGTAQKCRTNQNEPNVLEFVLLPPPPRGMTQTQRKIYKTKGAQLKNLKILTPVDLEMFISFCFAYGSYFDAEMKLTKIPNDSFLDDKTDYVFKRLSKISRDNFDRAKSIASEFGFTPSSRSKLVMLSNDDDGGDKDFD